MKTRFALLLVLSGTTAATVQSQGPLAPPGPPAPTMRTLEQIEARVPINANTTPGDADSLFRITQPGSYYLSGSIAGVAGKHGIEVEANHVTIDLRGFDVAGVPGSLSGFDLNNGGPGGLVGIVIFGGSIRGWGNDGILGGSSRRAHFHHLEISGNGGIGINIGAESLIGHCRINGCGGGGINANNQASIADSICTGNTGAGMVVGTDSVIRGCTASGNTGTGISAGTTSTVIECSANTNTANGILIGSGTVAKCAVRGSGGDGIFGGIGTLVESCAVANSGDDGIIVGSNSAVNNCTSSTNGGDGIQIAASCRVINNNCDGNATAGIAAGIHVPNALIGTNNDNRIDSNACSKNYYAIWVEDPGNLIIRNSAAGNTHSTAYKLAAENSYGPFLPIGLGGEISSSNPWANFHQ